ncbi:putative 1-phosphatidylinositol 3-phosphate 5-kinase [Battus philenor]|uniref:putative 1-phosphatidylinositol 3-phosphate 5-kinase n=1 Tax=Battus philenor TaxID=42288 RepID=UPI0035CED95B
MDKYDISQLTEFPRFESESNQSGVTTFFNKLWKLPLFSPNETTEDSEKSVSDRKQSVVKLDDANKQNYEDTKTEAGSYAVEFEARSLPNVLKRISSLVALGPGGGTRYADTELARYWMPDDISRECYECAARFGTLRRRHHCRVCGQIFCSRCCSQRVPGQIFGCAGGLRVCTYCCNVVLSYLRENDAAGDISPDLRTLQENLQVRFPDNRAQSSKGRDNFVFARELDERSELRVSPKESPHDLFRQLVYSLPTQQHRFRLVRYSGVWRGCDIMQWIMDNTNNKTRAQASCVCQALLAAGHMESVTEPPQFADYALYRPMTRDEREPDNNDADSEDCNRLVESVSSYCLDLNLDDKSARLIKATKTENKSSPSSEEEQPILDNSEGSSESVLCRAVEESGSEHLRLLMRQCLARAGLAPAWLDVLYPLCQQAADIIMPDMYGNDIDIRNYVQVKKVPGDNVQDSCVVQGVVLTKNVAHRGMPQQISNPTILLLDCSIAYQRVEGKLTSLEPLLMQEQEYLVRCAARITALRPRVVLVRGGAARAVQDALRGAGVALAAGVRERALRRAARCARADLVASVDARIAAPRLGTASEFYVKNFSGKTLMVLEGCAEPNLGCCILLRGGSLPELIRVKKVAKFMLLAFYNWKFEKAFLADIEAVLPEPGMSFGDDDEDGHTDKTNTEENRSKHQDKVSNDKESLFNETKFSDDQSKSNDSKLIDVNKTDKVIDMDDSNIDLFKNNKIETKSVTSEVIDDKEVSDVIKDDVRETDDSNKPKQYGRKVDGDKNLSCGVPIRDFSDPLRATMSMEDDVFLPKEEAELKADSHNERWSTDDAVLSMSPNIVIPAPQRPLQVPPAPHTPRPPRRTSTRPPRTHLVVKETHPFIKMAISNTADDPQLRAALAHYRATGAHLSNGSHKPECPQYKPSVLKRIETEIDAGAKQSETNEALDPLAPENHQRLSLLLYSYSDKSANVPDFCVNPWIVTMEMYGRHDISLGAFLERHCFDPDHRCPSTNCQVPMNKHVRRFVHGDVCITITCNTIGHSNVDKAKEDQSREVRVWTRCEQCGATSRGKRLSRSSLSLSLAQYVRTRISGTRYARARLCPHALHAHAHAFVARLTTACFRYSKISTYDIQLPPDVISINYDTKRMRDALISQLNDLMLKGHETFSSVPEGEIEKEKEYQAFKQHMEHIHLALTSASLHEQSTLASVVRNLWSVSDNIITGEKMLRDAQDKWSSPPQKNNKVQPEPSQDDKETDESCAEANINENSDGVGRELEKEHPSTEEDEEKGEKKTVKQILSQLLSSNQQANQSGIIIWSGVVPMVVRAGDIGSVIAATLASVTYQRTLKSQRHSTQSELDEESNNSTGRERSDAERVKTNASKSSEHIEVLLKEGLACRVYYAVQFHALRHALLAAPAAQHSPAPDTCTCLQNKDKDGKSLCDIEEGFIRSLAHCVPWAARGGKSGSTFCKTEDDRYVLKEMTKPEWQQFLEFAPHYFSYVTNCRLRGQPSLLARILGVFSVGGSGSGVLVMENVWYGASGPRFDLKGTARPRLAPHQAPNAPNPTNSTPVLVDLNLLHLRWETQLYVPSLACGALWASLERDTQFLAANGVMDYSLLLGVHHNTLVLGVIDYIRTFTWDKKLEHLVKKNLGSGQPTVLSPEQYKRRFCAACRKYFLQCPSHWDHLYCNSYA